MKKNEGEISQFFVQGSHAHIIEPDEFDAVQAELERRNELGRPMGCGSPFSAKIVCGDCFGWFGPKIWGSNTKCLIRPHTGGNRVASGQRIR